MTAKKNDVDDVKPAMQFVNPKIWDNIRLVKCNSLEDFPLILMDSINDIKRGIGSLEMLLCTIAKQYGRIEVLRSVGLVMRAGAMKYGDWNFLDGHGKLQLLAAMERHAMLIFDGEEYDPDNSERLGKNVTHYGCIVAGINMILYQEACGTSVNDGPPQSKGGLNGLRIESSQIATGITEANTRQWNSTTTRQASSGIN